MHIENRVCSHFHACIVAGGSPLCVHSVDNSVFAFVLVLQSVAYIKLSHFIWDRIGWEIVTNHLPSFIDRSLSELSAVYIMLHWCCWHTTCRTSLLFRVMGSSFLKSLKKSNIGLFLMQKPRNWLHLALVCLPINNSAKRAKVLSSPLLYF